MNIIGILGWVFLISFSMSIVLLLWTQEWSKLRGSTQACLVAAALSLIALITASIAVDQNTKPEVKVMT